jgi:hypothetical protein
MFTGLLSRHCRHIVGMHGHLSRYLPAQPSVPRPLTAGYWLVNKALIGSATGVYNGAFAPSLRPWASGGLSPGPFCERTLLFFRE